jgi:hypothetical protein
MRFNSFPNIRARFFFGFAFGIAALQRRTKGNYVTAFILLIDYGEPIVFHSRILYSILAGIPLNGKGIRICVD